MDYNVGDVVIIKGRDDGHIPNWTGSMYEWSGKAITIDKIVKRETWEEPRYVIHSSELDNSYEWEFRHIKCKIENVEEYKIEKAKREEKERIRKEELAKNMVYKPEAVYDLAISVFGEEYVSLKIDNKDKFNIDVHFPEFVISNSNDRRHTIKHLYVRFICQLFTPEGDRKMHIQLNGMRGECSLKEWESGYGHSHMSSVLDWTSFCLGSSVFQTLMSDLMNSLSEETWLLVFYSLENYLKWESLEGGPHRKMELMRYSNSGGDVDLHSELYGIIKNIPSSSFSYTNGLQLVETEELSEFYNKNSKTKKLSGYTNEQAEGIVEKLNKELNRYIEFKGKRTKCKITLDDTFDNTSISKEVVDRYNIIIREELKTYNKNLQYDHLKHNRKESLFGKAGII